jgi:hypothetical protein
MMVLNVEKPIRKLDVVPILVDNVLNEIREILDRVPMVVDSVEICPDTETVEAFDPMIVENEDNPD